MKTFDKACNVALLWMSIVLIGAGMHHDFAKDYWHAGVAYVSGIICLVIREFVFLRVRKTDKEML